MMASNINSDNVGPVIGLESHVSSYSTFTKTMNSVHGPQRDINVNGDRNPNQFKCKGSNYGNSGHKSAPCKAPPKKPTPISNVNKGGDLRSTQDKAGWCTYCIKGLHTEADCYINGNPPHKDSKLIPFWSISSAALGNGSMTIKDLNVGQLSNVFKDVQFCSTVLPMYLTVTEYKLSLIHI